MVLILAGDPGIGDPRGSSPDSKIPTPNLDRLAVEGLRFTDMHMPSAVCTPTRYGLLTGRYAWRSRLKSGELWGWSPPLIEPDRLTLPALLKQRGYATGGFGKWHLGLGWATREQGNNFPLVSPANRAMLPAVTLVCVRACAGAPETRRAGGRIFGGRPVGLRRMP